MTKKEKAEKLEQLEREARILLLQVELYKAHLELQYLERLEFARTLEFFRAYRRPWWLF